MYRTNLTSKDKSGAMAAVLAIHAGLAFALLQMSGQIDITDPQDALRVFDITEIVPPPPPPPPPQQAERPRPKEEEGGSPANIKSEATPVVAPKPVIQIPVPPTIAVTETPRQGAAPTQGASDVRGPGTGAGGTGTGTGTGSGAGSGGGGGIATRAQKLSPSLSMRDYPLHLRRRFPRGAGVLVTFTVLTNGRVTDCKVYQSSGDAEVDNMTCALVTSRFVYRPAFNRRGEPVVSQAGYRQGD
ncbi:MAG TPA: energy transducer TonB [Sphingomicrobium sp.]|nr:energy transducer TonB [Sphingomicrobium sp.]